MELYPKCSKTFNRFNMKTFKDLEFKQHPSSDGIIARITFDNGYGASVVRHEYSYGGKDGLFEVAVLGKDGDLTYDTPVTNDVIGYLEPEGVAEIMEQVQGLK